MPLDLDIASADPAMLEKIKAQDYRDDLVAIRSYRAAALAVNTEHKRACAAIQQAAIDWQKEQFFALPPELTPEQRMRLKLAVAIAPKYFTTTSNITLEGWRSDAAQDAGRFGAGLAAAVATVLTRVPLPDPPIDPLPAAPV